MNGFAVGLAGRKDEENGREEAVTDGDKSAFGVAQGLECVALGRNRAPTIP